MNGSSLISSWKKKARMTLTMSMTILVTRADMEAEMNMFLLSPTTAGSHIAVTAAFDLKNGFDSSFSPNSPSG